MITNPERTSIDRNFELIPINCNKILLLGSSFEGRNFDDEGAPWRYFLHLSIHEIRAYRVGPCGRTMTMFT